MQEKGKQVMMRINSNPDQNEGMALEIKKQKHMQTEFQFMVHIEWQGLTGKLVTKKTAYSKENKLNNAHFLLAFESNPSSLLSQLTQLGFFLLKPKLWINQSRSGKGKVDKWWVASDM